MNKAVKGFLTGLAMTATVLIPAACKHKDTKVPTTPVVTPPAADTAPNVPMVTNTTPQPTQVKNDDFVNDKVVKTDELPSDTEELNRYVQQRGLIADAFFNYDESTLSADSQAALTTSANWLKANPKYNLLVEGHCDERGTEQYNLALGDRRAQTAKDYLATLGVDASRIRTVSYGEERPFDPGHDESAWAKNRRAHLVLVGK